MVPHVAPVHPGPETLHVTAVFVEFATVAVNCCVPFTAIVVGDADTVTETLAC